MKQNTSKDVAKQRLTEFLKKVKQQKPVIANNVPSGAINRTDKGFKDD